MRHMQMPCERVSHVATAIVFEVVTSTQDLTSDYSDCFRRLRPHMPAVCCRLLDTQSSASSSTSAALTSTTSAACMRACVHACVRACVRAAVSCCLLGTASSPVPVPVPAPLTSATSACACACVCASGRAHRPRARDRAVPAERDGAIGHENCSTVPLHTAPVRRRPAPARRPEGRPARASRGRRTVAFVSEIATPSNTSSPRIMATAPPFLCTRADAERSGAHRQSHSGLTLMGTIMIVALARIGATLACAPARVRIVRALCARSGPEGK
jgi:hypothetical protein